LIHSTNLPSKLALSLAFASLFISSSPWAEAKSEPSPDRAISIKDNHSSEKNTVIFRVNAERTIDATITFDCDGLENLRPSQKLPYTFTIKEPGKEREFMRLEQATKGAPWSYGHWHFRSRFGSSSSAETTDYPYALPYSPDEHYVVIQSYFGKFSHFRGSSSQYAVDFDMPEGSVVRTARSGVVIAYRDDSDVGGKTEKFKGSDNYVIIKHDDGTYGTYAHLKHNGVHVKLGQSLAEGDEIGLSGATGWADKPHLHFSVYRVLDSAEIESLPFHFKIGKALIRRPIEGVLY